MSKVIDNSQFVHTHCHGEYSSFDGMISVNDLVMHAREHGFPALALTDHGNMGGLIKFINYCTSTKDKKGKDIPFPTIKPILGIEAYMAQDRHRKEKNLKKKIDTSGNYHLILLAKNWKGYQNICSLSHKAYTEGFYFKPRLDFDLLSQYSEGIICQTACLKGIVNQLLLYDKYDAAKKASSIFKDIFGENFFLEMMYHGMTAQSQIMPDIIKLSNELDIPIVCSNDVHYLAKEHSKSQEVLMCMSTQTCMNNPKHMRHEYNQFYMKSAAEMNDIFGFCPESMSNTLAIAEMVDFDDIKKNLFVSMRIPNFEIPSTFAGPQKYLEHLALEGMKKKGWQNSQPHVDALKKELADIKVAKDNNGYDFATYFLVVWDIARYCHDNNIILGPGRGSGYASVLLRCLDVCYGPDPLKYGLIWERFLGFSKKRYVKAGDFFT